MYSCTGNVVYLGPKNENYHEIVLLTQEYILNIVDLWKAFKKDVEDKPKGDHEKLLHRNKGQNYKHSNSNSKSKKVSKKTIYTIIFLLLRSLRARVRPLTIRWPKTDSFYWWKTPVLCR